MLKNAFSALPFLCEGFKNLLHFFCVPPKARDLALECYYSLFVNGGKMLVLVQAVISLSFLCIEGVFVCKFGTNSAVQLGFSC